MSMPKPYSIIVSSQKGGVGKTTIAVNLATAIRQRGYKVLLVDGDYSNPSVGFHLGMEGANTGIRAVVTGKAKLANTVAVHNPTGLHVLINEITSKPFHPDSRQQQNLHEELERSGYDFVIMDMPPGAEDLDEVAAFCCEGNKEALIVLTPEMSACSAAIRLAALYEKQHVLHSMVVNRVRNRRYELGIEEIENAVGEGLIGILPEDENVPISIAQHIPVALLKGRSDFSNAMNNLSRRISDRVGWEPSSERKEYSGRGFFAWLRRLFAWAR
jgi:MinD-like ATPase involved in chromosome partitioning or flagellar assembly